MRSAHNAGCGHKRREATSEQALAEVAEARDRGGDVPGWVVGLDRGAPVRRQRQQVFRWQRLADESGSTASSTSSSGLVPVTITPEPEDKAAPAQQAHSDTIDRGRRRLPCACGFELRRPCFEARARRTEEAMIPMPSGVRVWLSVGRTDMRRAMDGSRCRCRRRLGATHSPGIFLTSGAPGPT